MKKFMIIIDGPSGAGKTTIGELLATKLKRTAIISSDKIKWFLSDYDRSEKDQEITGRVLRAICKTYIESGISVLLPQGFWKKEYIEPYIKIAKDKKLKLFIYQLDAPRKVLLKRIKNRPKQIDAKTAISQKRIISNLEKWGKYKYPVEKVFDTGKLSAEKVAKLILSDLKKLK